jgi:exodeoxyribonuclease VII small subunit
MTKREKAPKREKARAQKPESGAEATEGLTFEVALNRLSEVVDRLEGGDLKLEDSLRTFERGVELSRHCASQLDAAERRIEVLLRDSEGWVVRPFSPAPGDDGEVAEEDEAAEEDW